MESWIERATPLLPAHATRLCELNLNGANAAVRASLLARMPGVTSFVGLSFADAVQRREELRKELTLEPALRNRSVQIFFGDKMRTVRAAPGLDACDVLLLDAVHEEASNAPAGGIVKKVIGDLPNSLQRMAADGDLNRNLLVVRGASACGSGSGSSKKKAATPRNDLCAAWAELTARELVVSASCMTEAGVRRQDGAVPSTPVRIGERWCIGRVVSDSACSARHPLLPTLPVLRKHALALEGSSNALVPPTSTFPTPRPASAYVAEGWRAEEVGGLRLGYWWRYFTVLQNCGGGVNGSDATHPSTARGTSRARRAARGAREGARLARRSDQSDGTSLAGGGLVDEGHRRLEGGGAGEGVGRQHVCLLFKNHIFESWVGGVTSSDYGRTFGHEPELVREITVVSR